VYNEDRTLLENNFREYINGFSDNVQDIIEHFDYRAIIGKMVTNARLAPIISQYKDKSLGPDNLSNLEMGYIYEELLRRFSEQSGEEAGDHFTPREIIRLMVEMLDIPIPTRHTSIYDPACGTGGMLSVSKEHLLDKASNDTERDAVQRLLTLHGHELSPSNYAICQADMLIKGDSKAEIYYGNSLIPHTTPCKKGEEGDQLAKPQHKFDFMLSNPPFGVTWGGKEGYEKEVRKLKSTRYRAGIPRTNDGALLFLQTILEKIKPVQDGGSKIAIIFNGSPLSNGDCGSGESEIRRWIIETNDWLEAIVMLPDQLFYNTGIYTYVWILTNNKPADKRGKVMLIDAREQFVKEPKSFGYKRHKMELAHRQWILDKYRNGWTGADEHIKIFNTTDFSYHKVKVVFWQTDENDEPATITETYSNAFSATSMKKEQDFYNSDIAFKIKAKSEQSEHTVSFSLRPQDSFAKIYEKKIKETFADELRGITDKKEIKKFVWSLQAEVQYTHRHYVKDDEYIPHGEDIEAFLEREIGKEIISWEDSPQLGYEILPNKYFYKYVPPRDADEVLGEFWKLEKEAEGLLKRLEGE
jgi:type I restriction enzyme M protein